MRNTYFTGILIIIILGFQKVSFTQAFLDPNQNSNYNLIWDDDFNYFNAD